MVPVTPPIMKELNINGAIVGCMVAAFAVTQLIAPPPAGKCVLIAYEFDPETYWESYRKLVKRIIQQQFTILSDVYELFMPIHYSPRRSEAYLVEMKIRILN